MSTGITWIGKVLRNDASGKSTTAHCPLYKSFIFKYSKLYIPENIVFNSELELQRIYWSLKWLILVFGIGAIIYIGIEMGGLFTLGLHSNKLVTCGEVFNILRPSLLIVFIFMQMHFIFLNHKMNVFRKELPTRFFVMERFNTENHTWMGTSFNLK